MYIVVFYVYYEEYKMKLNRIMILVSMFALTANAFAFARSSTIKLDDFTVSPLHETQMSLAKLPADVNYSISCLISSNGVSKQGWDDIQIITSLDSNNLRVNGNALAKFNQASISVGSSATFDMYNVNSSPLISVRNLDDTDTLTVFNCFAKPIT
jgi:hypothetical protein